MFVFLIHFMQAWWAGVTRGILDANNAGAYLLLVIIIFRNDERNDGSHATVTQYNLVFFFFSWIGVLQVGRFFHRV